MARSLAAALLAILSAGCAGLAIRSDRVTRVGAEEAAALMLTRTDMALVDVSPPDIYEAGHIPNAMNIPRSQLWFRQSYLPEDPGSVILIYDAQGERSLEAAIMLKREGYYNVYELRGGALAWLEAGYLLYPPGRAATGP